MPTKRCEICGKVTQIDNYDSACKTCEEKELDLLVAVYAYIHCNSSDFVPPKEIMGNVGPIGGLKPSLSFLRSWANKNWLEKNYFEALGVPLPIGEIIANGGFDVTPSMKSTLASQKKKRPTQPPPETIQQREVPDEPRERRAGMVFMEKQKD